LCFVFFCLKNLENSLSKALVGILFGFSGQRLYSSIPALMLVVRCPQRLKALNPRAYIDGSDLHNGCEGDGSIESLLKKLNSKADTVQNAE
jgi:hypothetical protein